MASKKASKKTEKKVEEAVVEEEVPVEEPAPAPKAEKKSKAKAKAELPEMVGYAKPTTTFVEEAHQALLGRSATESELEYYAGLVDVKGYPLPEIVRQMKMSGEYQATLPLVES
tara:strand:+ start:10115 stop:10456 length:342 start_codon:yes stop_codon:yes gene_type:complete